MANAGLVSSHKINHLRLYTGPDWQYHQLNQANLEIALLPQVQCKGLAMA